MLNQSAGVTLLCLLAITLASCGGSSGSDDISSANPVEVTPTDSGDPSATNSADTSTETSSESTVSADEIPGADLPDNTIVSTQSPGDSSATVCGTTGNAFSFENNEVEGTVGFQVGAPSNGFGWDGNNFCDMDNSVGINGIPVLIPEAEFSPNIDGVAQFLDPEWHGSTPAGIIEGVKRLNSTSNLLDFSVQGYRDGSRAGEWRAMHDNEHLYILFRANNENSSSGNNQVFRDSVDPRDDDSIEIFIDGDNSKGDSYDGTNDFHVTLAFGDSGSQFHVGPNSADGLQLRYAAQRHFNTAVYEIEINLASAGIVTGRPFGIEIQLNDDDNGLARDAKFGWFEPSGSTIADTSPGVFGTALLTSCAGDTYCGTDQLLSPNF